MDKRTIYTISINRVMDVIGDVTKNAEFIKSHLKNGTKLSEEQLTAVREGERLLLEAKKQLAIANPFQMKRVKDANGNAV